MSIIKIPKQVATPEARRALAERHRTTLLITAGKVQQKARNYRGFKVGCAMLIVDEVGAITIRTGVNVMMFKGGHKLCAEMNALTSAVKHRDVFWIVAVAVVGMPMADDHSKVESDTLHPCLKCREIFVGLTQEPANKEFPEFGPMMYEDAVFFTSLPGGKGGVKEPFDEEHTLHDILTTHKHDHSCDYIPPQKKPRRSKTL